MKTRIVELILTTDRRGNGTDDDPIRQEVQLWSKHGELVASTNTDYQDRDENNKPKEKPFFDTNAIFQNVDISF